MAKNLVRLKTLADKAVTTAGTAERLSATSIAATSIIIRALDDNTGTVFIGDSDVGSGRGDRLTAGQPLSFEAADGGFFDLREIWVDVAVDGEGVSILYAEVVNR